LLRAVRAAAAFRFVGLGAVGWSKYDEAEKARGETEARYAHGLFRPIQRSDDGLTLSEVDTLLELEGVKQDEIRIKFIEYALSDPNRSQRLASRVDFAVHAAVGMNAALRARLVSVLKVRIEDADGPVSTRIVAAWIACDLEISDPRLRELSAEIIRGSAERDDPTFRPEIYVQSTISIAERTPDIFSQEHLDRLTRVVMKSLDE
jgi:hypothetical protein